MDLGDSNALLSFAEDIKTEYKRLLQQTRSEISPIEGATTIHEMLLERYVFVYVALRDMERDWAALDLQRYNQMLQLWLKIGSDLIEAYKELYAKGALSDVFVSRIMTIVAEEVVDSDTMRRIRARIETAAVESG